MLQRTIGSGVTSGGVARRVLDRRLPVAFTLTTFLSALLLFSVQPLFTKMVLPVLGGAPSVWAVALVFFQVALLAGYAYAHGLIRLVGAARAGMLHFGLMTLAVGWLPMAVPAAWQEPPPGDPSLWQIGLYGTAIGLPFLAVAANAPVLQALAARSGGAFGRNPYALYVASNLGSLLGLLGYPFVFEPLFGVSALAGLWAGGYILLIGAVASCGWSVRALDTWGAPAITPNAEMTAPAPRWRDRLSWIGLATVPAGLLTATSTYISMDVASAPLFWVVPLVLYLLTFVVVFRDPPLVRGQMMLWLQVISAGLALGYLSHPVNHVAQVSGTIGLVAFVITALVAHRTLYEARPATAHLTDFYLCMSVGGALGGLFSALVAPRLFSEVFEYPLWLALGFACRPGAVAALLHRETARSAAFFAALGLCLVSTLPPVIWVWPTASLMVGAAALALLANWRRPHLQLVAALFVCMTVAAYPSAVNHGASQRSYFGVYRVKETDDGRFRTLSHGTTLHGAQRIRDDAGRPVDDTTPTSYYHPKSPMAGTIGAVQQRLAAQGRRGSFAIVGLGTGALSCYARPGERWRFYEIDQTVVDIARDRSKFTFLDRCVPDASIVLGDARLTVGKEPDGSLDLLIVDAFSSDAVPVHLLTAEALSLYARKLKPDGILLLHISNRNLRLHNAVSATVRAVPELAGFVLRDRVAAKDPSASASVVAVMSKSADIVRGLGGLGERSDFAAGDLAPWTDEYSSLLPILIVRWPRF